MNGEEFGRLVIQTSSRRAFSIEFLRGGEIYWN